MRAWPIARLPGGALSPGLVTRARAVIDNPKARISETGFARVIMGLNGDKELAAAIAARDDVPPELRPWLAEALGQ